MPAAAAALAGVCVARWWLGRRGTVRGAAAAGLGVALAGLAGGPLAGPLVAALAALADLLATAHTLGAGVGPSDAR